MKFIYCQTYLAYFLSCLIQYSLGRIMSFIIHSVVCGGKKIWEYMSFVDYIMWQNIHLQQLQIAYSLFKSPCIWNAKILYYIITLPGLLETKKDINDVAYCNFALPPYSSMLLLYYDCYITCIFIWYQSWA